MFENNKNLSDIGMDAYIRNIIKEMVKEEVDNKFYSTMCKIAEEKAVENIKTLTTSSDVETYKDLESEFKVLASGVDEYGNNISLTSDKYERYKACIYVSRCRA